MDRCPICDTKIENAVVICRACGEELPLRVVVVSEGSRGGLGFAVVRDESRAGPHAGPAAPEDEVYER